MNALSKQHYFFMVDSCLEKAKDYPYATRVGPRLRKSQAIEAPAQAKIQQAAHPADKQMKDPVSAKKELKKTRTVAQPPRSPLATHQVVIPEEDEDRYGSLGSKSSRPPPKSPVQGVQDANAVNEVQEDSSESES